jgi:phenylpyruvate tautomerase PptA (4-oxalocrotonate tautomerase family)
LQEESIMPYVHINLSKPLEAPVKKELAAALGSLISIIPTKSERGLMIRIDDGCGMYFRGAEADCAYVDVRMYMTSQHDKKGEFARAFLEAIHRIAGIEIENIYMSFLEYGSWVVGGDIK